MNTVGQPLITLGLRIQDKSTGEILGVLLTDIEVSTLSNIIREGIGKNGNFVLSTSDGTIITASNSPDISENTSFSYAHILSSPPWRLTGYLDPSLIENTIFKSVTPIIGLTAVIVLMVLIIASSISKRITKPLQELTSLMEIVQSGNFNVTMEIVGDDEVTQLSKSFNIMVSKINALMIDLHEEHEKLRIAEMKTLENQINPHFLYNTFDSIIWLVRKKRMEDVNRLVFALSKLMRIGLNRGKTLVTLQEEIEHIHNYIIIQEIRYADDFTYAITLPEQLKKNKTLKLILQPLVENAIMHGVQHSETAEHITIEVIEAHDGIVIEVTNTGAVIPEERVVQINEMLAGSEEGDFGLGLKNVNERIRLYFGKQYGLHFSHQNGSTTVRVDIPRI